MHSFYSWVISHCTYIPQFLYPFICQWTSRLLLCPMLCYAKSLQSCPTLCDPIDSSPTGSLSLGFSRQEHWSGLPFPSPMHGSEVAQSCPTLSNPMDCSLPGSSVHGIFQARVLEWGAIAFSLLCPSCCKKCCSEHWGTYISFNYDFLRVYAQ